MIPMPVDKSAAEGKRQDSEKGVKGREKGARSKDKQAKAYRGNENKRVFNWQVYACLVWMSASVG